MNLLVILAFCAKDKPQAILLSEWLRDLGGVSEHECMLVFPPSTNPAGLIEPLKEAFGVISTYPTPDDRDGWPAGANVMMRRACTQIQYTKPRPWLWLEPDAIPLRSTWLDEIAAEYAGCKKPFMGARVEIKDVPLHMSGIGVYPGNAPTLAPGLLRADKTAFDVEAAKDIIPRAHWTHLIQHEWKPKTFPDAGSLVRLSPEAVIYHQSKDGALIRRLREQKEHPLEQALAACGDGEPPKNDAKRWADQFQLIKQREGGDTPCPSAAAFPSPVQHRARRWEEFMGSMDAREMADLLAEELAKLAGTEQSTKLVVTFALKRAGLLAKTSRRQKKKSV